MGKSRQRRDKVLQLHSFRLRSGTYSTFAALGLHLSLLTSLSLICKKNRIAARNCKNRPQYVPPDKQSTLGRTGEKPWHVQEAV